MFVILSARTAAGHNFVEHLMLRLGRALTIADLEHVKTSACAESEKEKVATIKLVVSASRQRSIFTFSFPSAHPALPSLHSMCVRPC